MDGVEAYRQFSPELRARIEGKNISHTLDTRLPKMRFGVNFKLLGSDPPITRDLLKEAATFLVLQCTIFRAIIAWPAGRNAGVANWFDPLRIPAAGMTEEKGRPSHEHQRRSARAPWNLAPANG